MPCSSLLGKTLGEVQAWTMQHRLADLDQKQCVLLTQPKPRLHNGGRVHYVMLSRIQWKPFWLATQLYPQNDWTGWQNGVNYDVCAQSPSGWFQLAEIHFPSKGMCKGTKVRKNSTNTQTQTKEVSKASFLETSTYVYRGSLTIIFMAWSHVEFDEIDCISQKQKGKAGRELFQQAYLKQEWKSEMIGRWKRRGKN